MKTIGYLIQKEFKQIFRNKGMIPIIFILPLLQLVILSNAATFDIKNINLSYVDYDKSSSSRALIEKFDASTYFHIATEFQSSKEATDAMAMGEVDIVIEIPRFFERNLWKQQNTDILVTINAIDGATAGVKNGYVNQIIRDFNKKHIQSLFLSATKENNPKTIQSIPSFWYNKTLNYKTYMVPGILVLLVTMITMFLSGMNIVREKEMGTLEQINVTPIKKYQFIIGKLFPFWIIGFALLTIGLLLAQHLFKIPMLGNFGLLYFYTAIYMLVILGMGLFISNFSDTQQQAMFIAWFFMVIFILMSGLFTPIESMPIWAQWITEFNPVKYFVQIMRMVILKGAGFTDILSQFYKTLLFAIIMNVLAVISYRKTL